MNPSPHPTFIVVIVKVNIVSKTNVIKNATNNPEYFSDAFKRTNHLENGFIILKYFGV